MWTVLLTTVLLAQAPAAQPDPHAGHAAPAPAPQAAPTPRDPNLPPSEPQGEAAVKASPRHGEFVDIKTAAGTPIRTWVVYPERKDKAGVVILIFDIHGLGYWIRGVADQLAKEGFIAVVPDLISGMGPNGGGSEAAANDDEVVKLVRGLAPAEVQARLNAIHDYATKIPAANGKTATLGFCWGGGVSFAYAAAQPDLDAAVVFYGTSPETADLAKIKAPVLGLYGSDDARVNVTVGPAEAEMKKLGKTYEVHTYEGAGHAFLRSQDGREGANFRATQQAWPRVLAFLREHLK
ncbi:MAG TPA: dienelactone hydrolase family protein [Thermoanaerobaculia bacterium]|nr:dienelactone hydrolase family protein [Thermoanaerobaculia bacterium]